MYMTGIGNNILYSYTAAKTARIPRNVSQVVAGFVSNDENQKPKADVSKMRRALRSGAENLASTTQVSVIDNMQLYSKALEKQRKSSKDTSLAKQKLKYSFKKISSKIINSKTSTAAREVVAQAKREIQKLKAAKRTGKYDEEELEAALDHAKAMERIARKKARHLEEEEMAKRCSSDSGSSASQIAYDEDNEDDKNSVKKEISELRDDLKEISDKADNEEYIESDDVTDEMISEITDSMEEMLDSIEELSDLMDEIMSNPVNMDPEDIDAMVIKHRNKEMKEITKADSEYLKALFDHYEKIKADGAMPAGGFEGSDSASVAVPPASASAIDVAL